MSTPPKKSWYKQFWPWFLIALPATAVVCALSTVYIAFKNQDAVVRDDWYEDGKMINQSLKREDNAKAEKLVASILIDDATGEVSVSLTHASANTPAKLDLKLSHPTDAKRDQDVVLTRQADGSYHGALRNALKGRYYVGLETKEWRLEDSETFPTGRFDIHP